MANRGSFKKGEKRPNQGKRGPNKENKALREMILQALDEQKGGGVAYLKEQAASNPNAFLSLLGKVLPTQLAGDLTINSYSEVLNAARKLKSGS